MSNVLEAQRLVERRAGLAARMTEILQAAEGADRDLTDEERTEFDRIDADQSALKGRIDRIMAASDAERAADSMNIGAIMDAAGSGSADGDGAGAPEDRATRWAAIEVSNPRAHRYLVSRERFQRWARGEPNTGLPNQINLRLRPSMPDLSMLPNEVRAVVEPELRALKAGTATAGQELVPEGFVAQLEESLLHVGGMRNARTTILRTATGNDLPWPTTDDTSNEGSLLGEASEDTGSSDPTFSAVTFGAYKYTSDIVQISLELLQDDAIGVESVVGGMLGTRLGRIMNRHATTGTGSSQPNGVVTASGLGKTFTQNNSIIYLDLVDLQHSVDPAYRMNAEWMCHDSAIKAIKKLVDGDSRPLWSAGVAVREPDTILGSPYVVNQHMAAPAGAVKSMLYGDFSKYIIRDVLDVTLRRLVERYAEFHTIGFVAIMRMDGDLLDAGTDPIKHGLHPS